MDYRDAPSLEKVIKKAGIEVKPGQPWGKMVEAFAWRMCRTQADPTDLHHDIRVIFRRLPRRLIR